MIVQEEDSTIEQENNLTRYLGTYHTNRYTRGDFTKLQLLVMPHNIDVHHNYHQSLKIGNRSFTQVEPLVFQDVENDQYIAFEEDKNGNIQHKVDGHFS